MPHLHQSHSAGLASTAAIPNKSVCMCRSIVSYKGSWSSIVMKPSTEAGVQEECIVMELLKGGKGPPMNAEHSQYSVLLYCTLSLSMGVVHTECPCIN